MITSWTYFLSPLIIIISLIFFLFLIKLAHINCRKFRKKPWLVWLSGLSASMQIKGLPVQFPVRANTWVVARSPEGGIRKATTHWCFSPSLSPSFPLSENKINKIFKKKKEKSEKTSEWEEKKFKWSITLSGSDYHCDYLGVFHSFYVEISVYIHIYVGR